MHTGDGLRVLVIAPDAPGLEPLDWRDELAQIGQVPDVRLERCIGRSAVRSGVAARLHEWWDVVLWSGHGAPGRLLLTDGAIGADWLACMMRLAPAARPCSPPAFRTRDAALQSMVEPLSHAGMTIISTWVEAANRAAITTCVQPRSADSRRVTA